MIHQKVVIVALFYIPQTKWGYTGITLSVRLSVDAICQEFISNTTEHISFKLYAYVSYIYNVVIHVLFSLKYFKSYGSYGHFLLGYGGWVVLEVKMLNAP
jgi:hypothetical protein